MRERERDVQRLNGKNKREREKNFLFLSLYSLLISLFLSLSASLNKKRTIQVKQSETRQKWLGRDPHIFFFFFVGWITSDVFEKKSNKMNDY